MYCSADQLFFLAVLMMQSLQNLHTHTRTTHETHHAAFTQQTINALTARSTVSPWRPVKLRTPLKTHHSQPAAGEEKFHALAGEVEVAFKMTHLRMAYSSRGPPKHNESSRKRKTAGISSP
jgi:hypothetical protein